MPGKPGRGGPPPKRESQRRRANKPAVPVTSASSTGEVRGPELGGGEHSDLGRRWWEALRRSGQAQFYESSDWAHAELVVNAIDTFVERPSAMMLASINSMSATLLVTEGDRRRLHMELEKAPAAESEQDAAIAHLAEYRKRSKA